MIVFDGMKLIGIAIMVMPLVICGIMNIINRIDDFVTKRQQKCKDVLVSDASPVGRGRWVESHIPGEKYVCSECGGACWYYDYQGEVAKSRYCPNCGAKME